MFGRKSKKKEMSPLHGHSDKKLREVTSFGKVEYQTLISAVNPDPAFQDDRQKAMVLIKKDLENPKSELNRFGGLANVLKFRVLKNQDETDTHTYIDITYLRSTKELEAAARKKEAEDRRLAAEAKEKAEKQRVFDQALKQARDQAVKKFHNKFPKVEKEHQQKPFKKASNGRKK